MSAVKLTPNDLRARAGETSSPHYEAEDNIDRLVNGIRHMNDPEQRLGFLKAVYDGMLDVERREREATFSRMTGGVPGVEHWGTARVSPWGNHASGPLVGCSLGAPPARFERVGRPQLDYAAMRFIVAARENFELLLDLAHEGIKARSALTQGQDNG